MNAETKERKRKKKEETKDGFRDQISSLRQGPKGQKELDGY